MMPQVGLTERTGGNSYGGKVRTMCIRGPHRVDKSQAEEDAEKLGAAAKDGDTRRHNLWSQKELMNHTAEYDTP